MLGVWGACNDILPSTVPESDVRSVGCMHSLLLPHVLLVQRELSVAQQAIEVKNQLRILDRVFSSVIMTSFTQ